MGQGLCLLVVILTTVRPTQQSEKDGLGAGRGVGSGAGVIDDAFKVNSVYRVKPAGPGWDRTHQYPPQWAYQEFAEYFRSAYADASPFPHIYIDGLFPSRVVQQCADEFPSEHGRAGARADSSSSRSSGSNHGVSEGWTNYNNDGQNQSRKFNMRNEQFMGAATWSLVTHFRTSTFVSFLESITGITMRSLQSCLISMMSPFDWLLCLSICSERVFTKLPVAEY
jgi:hypothetical protein